MHGTPLHSEGKKWICSAYEAFNQGMGLLQECHRESGKTTVFSKFFLSFRLGHKPHQTWAIIRINDNKANETANAISNIIDHDPRWKQVFPHVVGDPDIGWGAKGYWVKRTDISYSEWTKIKTSEPPDPTFVGYGWSSGSIIGSRWSGGMIVDDIHDEENTSSSRMINKVKKTLGSTIQLCLMNDTWEIWNFTPWTKNDAYAAAKVTDLYIHSKSPALIADENGELWPEDPLIPLSGKYYRLTWPEQWGFKRLSRQYKKVGLTEFGRMMMLDLEAIEGQKLKKGWLRYWNHEKIGETWPVFFGVDYASTADKLKEKDQDNCAICAITVIPYENRAIIIDGFYGIVTQGEAIQKLVSMSALYPHLVAIGVESIGKGQEFYYTLLNFTNLPVLPATAGGKGKGYRFETVLGPRFQMNRAILSDEENPFITAFKREWLEYPNGVHDDALDAAYYAFDIAKGYLIPPGEYQSKLTNPLFGSGKKKAKYDFGAFGRRVTHG